MSDATILRTPRARIDLAECYATIGERNPGAAHRFREAAKAKFTALARSPRMGAPYEIANPRLEGLRCARVRRFRNYLIFYRPIDGGIHVIRVLHAARDLATILAGEA